MTTAQLHSPHLTLDQLGNSTLLLIGLGREGWSSYQWLRQHFPNKPLLVLDDAPLDTLSPEISAAANNDPQLTIAPLRDFDPASSDALSKTVLLKTPGIPREHPVVAALLAGGAQLTSNTQLFFDQLSNEHRITTIGVTGTKGKSTTSTAVHHVLTNLGHSAVLAGNIGIPPLAALADITAMLTATPASTGFVVLELSAHQLRELSSSPNIAVVLDVVPEHLDYYAGFDEYLAAKSAITRYQTDKDIVVYNPQLPAATQLAQLSSGRHLCFDPNYESSEMRITLAQEELTTTIHDGAIWYHQQQVIELSKLKVRGHHTAMNVLPSVVIAGELHAEPANIGEALSSFTGLAHRLEMIAEYQGIRFYDDSLATVPEAAIQALRTFADQPVILLAGGYDRKQDFTAFAEAIAHQSVKLVLLFRPTGERIAAALSAIMGDHFQELPNTSEKVSWQPGTTYYVYPETMAQAMTLAKTVAHANDVVLLSPASASFGQFKDYADRSQQFAAAAAAAFGSEEAGKITGAL